MIYKTPLEYFGGLHKILVKETHDTVCRKRKLKVATNMDICPYLTAQGYEVTEEESHGQQDTYHFKMFSDFWIRFHDWDNCAGPGGEVEVCINSHLDPSDQFSMIDYPKLTMRSSRSNEAMEKFIIDEVVPQLKKWAS